MRCVLGVYHVCRVCTRIIVLYRRTLTQLLTDSVLTIPSVRRSIWLPLCTIFILGCLLSRCPVLVSVFDLCLTGGTEQGVSGVKNTQTIQYESTYVFT
jgi:hypothetical protein